MKDNILIDISRVVTAVFIGLVVSYMSSIAFLALTTDLSNAGFGAIGIAISGAFLTMFLLIPLSILIYFLIRKLPNTKFINIITVVLSVIFLLMIFQSIFAIRLFKPDIYYPNDTANYK